MTGEPLLPLDLNVAGTTLQNKYCRAVNNRHGVRNDLEALCKFVREFVFFCLIHDARGAGTKPDHELMGENGQASVIFIDVFLRDKERISNVELVGSTLEEKEQYLRFLWKEGLQTKGRFNIRKALSNEKSAVYAGISESFKSKCCKKMGTGIISDELELTLADDLYGYFFTELVHDCSVNRVPFPALETFEDRTMFPIRYFLFFDTFVRAGRHNREMWNKAIKENKGVNDMRFGPAIFEAHVRTTVRENYFKWIFQQLSDTDDVTDEDVEAFQLEYDENVYTDLPATLVCTHKELTRFPFKKCEIEYGEPTSVTSDESEEDDNDSYCSANSIDRPATTSPDQEASERGSRPQDTWEKKFFLVYKNVNNEHFNQVREQQRRNLKSTIEKARVKHKDVLQILKETIVKIREVKKKLPETDPMYKVAVAEAKKNLRLFKDPYEGDDEGPFKKKRRKSIENQTRFSDSKVTFFSEATEQMKQEEQAGIRKSWEAIYKQIWNKYLLAPRTPVINIPVPQVNSIVRDMADDVNQLLADCAGMIEQV